MKEKIYWKKVHNISKTEDKIKLHKKWNYDDFREEFHLYAGKRGKNKITQPLWTFGSAKVLSGVSGLVRIGICNNIIQTKHDMGVFYKLYFILRGL